MRAAQGKTADWRRSCSDQLEPEAAAELLLEAKGYEDCVVFMSEDGVSVVVSTGEEGLQTEDIARITDIVKQETGLSAESIKIMEVN